MKGLDNNDIFKHGASAKKATPQKPYINTYINVSKYNAQTRQMDNQGRFILAVTRTTQATNLTVYKSGAHNLFSFSLSRNINWTLQNQIYVYITDPKGVQWLFQFQNAAEAAQATAAVGILMSVKKSTECAVFDTNIVKATRGLQIGDTATLSFHCFSISQFPFVACPPTSSDLDFTVQIARDKIPTGFVTGVLGMTIGSTRSIYVPSALTQLENGQRDNRFPQANLAIVTTLKSANFDQEPSSQQPHQQSQSQLQTTPSNSEIHSSNLSQHSDVSDSILSSAQPLTGKLISTAPSTDISSSAELSSKPEENQTTIDVESSGTGEQEDEMDPEEYERIQKIKRIQKMGGVSAFAVPSFPQAATGDRIRRRSEQSINIKPANSFDISLTQAPQRRIDECGPNNGNNFYRSSGNMNELEKSITMKLDLLTGGTNDVMRGVSCMSIQLQEKIDEINRMKQEMEEYRAKATNSVSFKDLEIVRREADQLNNENKILENKLKDLEQRYNNLSEQSKDNAETAKQREKSIIKKLMGDAFSEISDIFDEESSYKGTEVSEQLYSILRKNAFSAMDDINKNGLF